MMTPEEIAVRIRNGEEKLIPALWERFQDLYAAKSFRYYGAHREQCARCGVDLDDVKQQAFFAFLQSIEAFNPDSGLTFSAFINFPFMQEMQQLTRTRSSGQRNDALQLCDSLDKEIDTDDGSGSTLHDLVPDPAALDFLELLDAQSVGAMIRREVQTLPEQARAVVSMQFFDGMTQAQISEKLGVSISRISSIKRDALHKLSKRRLLVELWNEMHHTAQLRQLAAVEKKARSDDFQSARIYEKIMHDSGDTWIDRAERHAEQLRQSAEQAGRTWTRDDQITAILDYLRSDPAQNSTAGQPRARENEQ